jgi:hypothetical protein
LSAVCQFRPSVRPAVFVYSSLLALSRKAITRRPL